MLDELRELDAYTFDIEDKALRPRSRETALIRKHKKRNDFICMPHVLEVIARKCLFAEDAAEDPMERANDAIRLLRHWCGFAPEDDEMPVIAGLEHCHNWMECYIDMYSELLTDKDAAKQEKEALHKNWRKHQGKEAGSDSKKRASKAKSGYEKELFGSSELQQNEAPFQRCVARALRRGPLRRWCMVGKLMPHEVCEQPKQRALDARSDGTVLTITALCLLRREESRRAASDDLKEGFVPLNLGELNHWCGRNKEYVAEELQGWLYEGDPIFEKAIEKSGVQPWRLSEGWLHDGAWQLIDITESEEPLRAFCRDHAGEGFLCYRDAKYGAPDFAWDKNLKRWCVFPCDNFEEVLEAEAAGPTSS